MCSSDAPSILPNLLVPGIADALRATSARKIYVCNIATQQGETDHFSTNDHLKAIERHAGPGLFDSALANDNFPQLPDDANFQYVRRNSQEADTGIVNLHLRDMVDINHPWRHDSAKLAQALMDMLNKLYTSDN